MITKFDCNFEFINNINKNNVDKNNNNIIIINTSIVMMIIIMMMMKITIIIKIIMIKVSNSIRFLVINKGENRDSEKG